MGSDGRFSVVRTTSGYVSYVFFGRMSFLAPPFDNAYQDTPLTLKHLEQKIDSTFYK